MIVLLLQTPGDTEPHECVQEGRDGDLQAGEAVSGKYAESG